MKAVVIVAIVMAVLAVLVAAGTKDDLDRYLKMRNM